MKEISINETLKLVKSNSKPAISIYLRTDHQEPDGAVRIKNNLQRLYHRVEALIARTYDGKTRERLLAPLRRSIASLRISRGQGSIAIYHSEDFTGMVKLPMTTRDMAIAAESYHLKPILRCMQLRRKYYLLVMRKRYAEFFLVSPDGPPCRLERMELFSKSEKSDEVLEKTKIWTRGGLRIRKQKEVRQAMELLNRQIETHWLNERLPLLIAGSHQHQTLFRKACSYIHLLDRGLLGHMDSLGQQNLMGWANKFMEQHFAQIDELAVASFRRAKSSGLTSTNLVEISQAAAQGRIQSLLIAEDQHLWGLLDRTNGNVHLMEQKTDARSDDILDDLAELTLLKGGQVTVLPSVQMPAGSPIAAILRWSHSPDITQSHQKFRPYTTLDNAKKSMELTA